MNQDKLYYIITIPLLILLSSNLYAQGENPPASYGQWKFSAHIGLETLDSEAAWQEYIEDSAYNIGFTADYAKGQWLTSLGLSIIVYSDDAGFSQTTRNNFGNVETSDSSATGAVFSFAFGPKWQLGEAQDTAVFTQAGVGLMVESSRSISYCSNCYEEDINIDSGMFAKVGVLQNISVGSALGISLAQFLSGDQERTINFIWSMAY